MAIRKQVFAVCLLITIAVMGTYFAAMDKSQFFQYNSASFTFMLQNQATKSLNVSFFLYIDHLNFNDTHTTHLHENFTVWIISDGSGIGVYCNGLAPSRSLRFRIDHLKPTSSWHNIGDARLSLSFAFANESDFDYNGVISLLNNEGMSVASSDYSKASNSLQIQVRTLTLYFNMLIVLLAVFFMGIVTMTVWNEAKWFPIVTLSIVLLTLFLYVFVGSGFEIFASNWWGAFVPLSVFIHGFDWHIFGNVVIFATLSIPFEWFLRMKDQWMKRGMVFWYFVPLFLPTLLVLTPWSGFGLSFSIEIMTWTLWAYIVLNYDRLITSRSRALLAVLAGIPSYTFVSWAVSYLFGSYNGDPYSSYLAIRHIGFGIVSCMLVVGALIVVFRHGIRQKLRKAIVYRSKETGVAFNGASSTSFQLAIP